MSKSAREAMAEAGRQNLAQWRSRARTREHELEREVGTFRDGLLKDAGPNPTTTRIGLIEAAVSTYAAILRTRYAVIKSRRSDVATLTERVSWLTGNLCRLLKSLNLDAKPRPRCLADLIAPKVAANAEIERSKAPLSNESQGKPL